MRDGSKSESIICNLYKSVVLRCPLCTKCKNFTFHTRAMRVESNTVLQGGEHIIYLRVVVVVVYRTILSHIMHIIYIMQLQNTKLIPILRWVFFFFFSRRRSSRSQRSQVDRLVGRTSAQTAVRHVQMGKHK